MDEPDLPYVWNVHVGGVPVAHLTDGRHADPYVVCYVDNQVVHRRDGPAIIDRFGNKEWVINGERHRTDGPAVECADGTIYWYVYDQWHETIDEWGRTLDILNTEEFVLLKLRYG